MNNAKLWLVVKPTVGVPLFLTAVAVSSFATHVAVMKYSKWLPEFYAGAVIEKQADVAMAGPGSSAVVVFDSGLSLASGGAQQGVVVLPDGRTARVVFEDQTPIDGTKTASLE